MTAEALEIPPKPYTGEKARLTRAYDYLILVLALFLFIGAFHLHVALTAGDWDFWVDWKDRQMVAPRHPVDDDHLPGRQSSRCFGQTSACRWARRFASRVF